MAGRGSIHRAEYMNVGPAGTLPRAAFNWRDPTVLAAVGELGGSFDDGESAQASGSLILVSLHQNSGGCQSDDRGPFYRLLSALISARGTLWHPW